MAEAEPATVQLAARRQKNNRKKSAPRSRTCTGSRTTRGQREEAFIAVRLRGLHTLFIYISVARLARCALGARAPGLWQSTYVYGAPGCKLCMSQVAFARPACLFIGRNILSRASTSNPVHVNVWRFRAAPLSRRDRGRAARIWCPLSKLWPPWNPGAVAPLTKYRTYLCRKFSFILRRCGNLKEECRYVARELPNSAWQIRNLTTLKTPNKELQTILYKFGSASSAMRSFAP